MQLQPPDIVQSVLKLLENKVWKTLQDVSTWKDLLNRSPAAQDRMPTTEEWDVTKLQSFCTSRMQLNK